MNCECWSKESLQTITTTHEKIIMNTGMRASVRITKNRWQSRRKKKIYICTHTDDNEGVNNAQYYYLS